MAGERLEGGYVDGAVRVGDTVRRAASPWTPAVDALLAYLAGQGFTGAPRPLGFDEQGQEVLTFLEGETIGHRRVNNDDRVVLPLPPLPANAIFTGSPLTLRAHSGPVCFLGR